MDDPSSQQCTSDKNATNSTQAIKHSILDPSKAADDNFSPDVSKSVRLYFYCPICNTGFKRRPEATSHLQKKHQLNESNLVYKFKEFFNCDLCMFPSRFSFLNEIQLAKHRAYKHSDSPDKKRFKPDKTCKSSLFKYRKFRIKKMVHQCTICDHVFFRKVSLLDHVCKMHKKNSVADKNLKYAMIWLCNVCDFKQTVKFYSSTQKLDSHVTSVHENAGSRNVVSGDVVPSGPINQVPSESMNEVPIETEDEGPSGSVGAVLSGPMDQVPSGSMDQVPNIPKDKVPIEPKDEGPSGSMDQIPSGSMNKVPSGSMDQVPNVPKDEVPFEPKDKGPSRCMDQIPSGSMNELPSRPMDQIPCIPKDRVSSGPMDQVPSGSMDQIPSGSINEVTSGPMDQIPCIPEDEVPIGPKDGVSSGPMDQIPSGPINKVPSDIEPSSAPYVFLDDQQLEEQFKESDLLLFLLKDCVSVSDNVSPVTNIPPNLVDARTSQHVATTPAKNFVFMYYCPLCSKQAVAKKSVIAHMKDSHKNYIKNFSNEELVRKVVTKNTEVFSCQVCYSKKTVKYFPQKHLLVEHLKFKHRIFPNKK